MGLEHVENPEDWALDTCESHCAASRAIPGWSEPQLPKIMKSPIKQFSSQKHTLSTAELDSVGKRII